MNSSFTYPTVSHFDIINLFHSILFWRYTQKVAEAIGPQYWHISFDMVWTVLNMEGVLPEARIKRLRGNHELCKIFLANTSVVEQWDSRAWDDILKSVTTRFCIRKGNRELTAGNAVNYLELCSRTKVHITRLGVRLAPSAVENTRHLLTHDQFLTAWEKYTAPFLDNKKALVFRVRRRNDELTREIWGGRGIQKEK